MPTREKFRLKNKAIKSVRKEIHKFDPKATRKARHYPRDLRSVVGKVCQTSKKESALLTRATQEWGASRTSLTCCQQEKGISADQKSGWARTRDALAARSRDRRHAGRRGLTGQRGALSAPLRTKMCSALGSPQKACPQSAPTISAACGAMARCAGGSQQALFWESRQALFFSFLGGLRRALFVHFFGARDGHFFSHIFPHAGEVGGGVWLGGGPEARRVTPPRPEERGLSGSFSGERAAGPAKRPCPRGPAE